MSDGARRATPNTHTTSANQNATTKVPASKLPTKIENALLKMRANPDAASNWLRRYQLILEDAQVSMAALSPRLIHFAAHSSAKLRVWAVEAVCALAVYSEEVQTTNLAVSVWEKIQPVLSDNQQDRQHDAECLQEDYKARHDEMMEGQERISLEVLGAAGQVSKEV